MTNKRCKYLSKTAMRFTKWLTILFFSNVKLKNMDFLIRMQFLDKRIKEFFFEKVISIKTDFWFFSRNSTIKSAKKNYYSNLDEMKVHTVQGVNLKKKAANCLCLNDELFFVKPWRDLNWKIFQLKPPFRNFNPFEYAHIFLLSINRAHMV